MTGPGADEPIGSEPPRPGADEPIGAQPHPRGNERIGSEPPLRRRNEPIGSQSSGAGDGDPAFVDDATVTVSDVSVWFGQKVALSELSCSFGPGVTGLLGPNGAGKTTLMRAMCGLLSARQGEVRVLDVDPRTDRDVQRRVALVPEEDAVPESLTARQLVRYQATLAGIRDRGAVDDALATVDLTAAADRRLGGFSKGMRQRAKVAAALVTDPTVLVLDEPLNGADPVQRRHLIDLFHRLGDPVDPAGGRTVIVSSHVLHEVQRLARRVIVIVHGRLAAAGDHQAIRDAMADRPRRVLLHSSDDRALAAGLLQAEDVVAVDLTGGHLTVATSSAAAFAAALPHLSRRAGVRLLEVRPLDASLDAVFEELTR